MPFNALALQTYRRINLLNATSIIITAILNVHMHNLTFFGKCWEVISHIVC